jgi:hypothetical protein
LISSTRSSARFAAAALALGGCATVPRELPTVAAPIELAAVPFFPQTEFQCGPAALATLLAHAGAAVNAETLVPEVYVEGLKGSLQPELLGATRRHGFIPYVLTPDPGALLAELESGRPVLVLQNLGVPRVPVWHYAVVVGTDGESMILRSGAEERRRERTSRFLRSWQRGENWAFVAVAPGELPASATAPSYVRALAGAEPLLSATATGAAYAAALGRWPSDELVLFAAAGHELATQDLDGATALYRRVLASNPAHAAARNNLANALEARGCHGEALIEARTALAAVAPGDELYEPIRSTLAEIEAAAATSTAASCP